MNKSSFGENMRCIRKTLKISQAELAKRSEINAAAISFFETGTREPSLKNIRKVCRGLGCTPNALIKL